MSRRQVTIANDKRAGLSKELSLEWKSLNVYSNNDKIKVKYAIVCVRAHLPSANDKTVAPRELTLG